jgi:hypothetical protein
MIHIGQIPLNGVNNLGPYVYIITIIDLHKLLFQQKNLNLKLLLVLLLHTNSDNEIMKILSFVLKFKFHRKY